MVVFDADDFNGFLGIDPAFLCSYLVNLVLETGFAHRVEAGDAGALFSDLEVFCADGVGFNRAVQGRIQGNFLPGFGSHGQDEGHGTQHDVGNGDNPAGVFSKGLEGVVAGTNGAAQSQESGDENARNQDDFCDDQYKSQQGKSNDESHSQWLFLGFYLDLFDAESDQQFADAFCLLFGGKRGDDVAGIFGSGALDDVFVTTFVDGGYNAGRNAFRIAAKHQLPNGLVAGILFALAGSFYRDFFALVIGYDVGSREAILLDFVQAGEGFGMGVEQPDGINVFSGFLFPFIDWTHTFELAESGLVGDNKQLDLVHQTVRQGVVFGKPCLREDLEGVIELRFRAMDGQVGHFSPCCANKLIGRQVDGMGLFLGLINLGNGNDAPAEEFQLLLLDATGDLIQILSVTEDILFVLGDDFLEETAVFFVGLFVVVGPAFVQFVIHLFEFLFQCTALENQGFVVGLAGGVVGLGERSHPVAVFVGLPF